MEAFGRLSFFLVFTLFVAFLPKISHAKITQVAELNEENWTEMLHGEWMVQFMAPWCPACSSLKGTWSMLGSRSMDLGIKVATVDVTTSPGLSGRFLVTALPTIYHVINGQFRQYSGPRDHESLEIFVSQSKWLSVTPSPWYRDPSKAHMAMLSHFFKLSQLLRSVHNILLEEYGVPTYGSYLIFAIATIFLGAILGLIVVCTIDFLFPPKRSERRPPQATTQKEEELINDDLVDEEEEEKEDDSDAEKHSQSDTPQESDSEEVSEKKDDGQGDKQDNDKEQKSASPQASPSVRKRKPRKAD